MPFHEMYRRQVALLVSTIPLVAKESCFALKGGTAINLFVRDMPRLSVDLDLAYLPISDRAPSLAAIDAALGRIADTLAASMPRARINRVSLPGERYTNRLIVRVGEAQIKIEVTPVLRGCVYEPALRTVSASVEEQFGFAEIQVVSFPDLFAGKIVAALDRQHPRDLFDVRDCSPRKESTLTCVRHSSSTCSVTIGQSPKSWRPRVSTSPRNSKRASPE